MEHNKTTQEKEMNIDGTEYVEKNYDNIDYSNWSPKAFVIGFFCGTSIMSIFLFCIKYSGIGL